jgi:hypothetical protein
MLHGSNGPFIESAALATVHGRLLFYPAAGTDWCELLRVFDGVVAEFHFSDVVYEDLGALPCPFGNSASYRLLKSKIEGKCAARMEASTQERPYRNIEPGRLVQFYEQRDDARRLKIVRRRGFGQYALSEFADRSIGIFVHRGDSPGEAGSNVRFLANQERRHEPLSRLYDKLSLKLADPALVVSDGSNARRRFLRKFHDSEKSALDAYQCHKKAQYRFGTFGWRCVGYLGRRYGPTLVWQLTRS